VLEGRSRHAGREVGRQERQGGPSQILPITYKKTYKSVGGNFSWSAQAFEIALKITYKKTYKGIFAPGIDTGRLVAVCSVVPQRLALRRWEDVGACDAGEMVG
jgi:hypothetical protein